LTIGGSRSGMVGQRFCSIVKVNFVLILLLILNL